MPADRTMGGEHPLAAIKRLAHWEVEDDIGMLRTRLACISAQADKVTAAPPEFALTPEQVALHEQYVVDHGSDHDEDCPGDDTCTCSKRPRNEAVNAICRYLAAPPEAADATITKLEQAVVQMARENRSLEKRLNAPDCRAAVRAALREVREAIMCDDGCLTVAGAVAILDAKLAALEDAP